MEPRKEAICNALAAFIRQRPGLEFADYGDAASYRAEMRGIARDKREAETLLAAVRGRDSITADMLLEAAKSAYSGRLTIRERPETGPCPQQHGPINRAKDCAICGPGCMRPVEIDYVTGQYWCTEYRRAACAVLASALWEWQREHAMPQLGAAPCGSGKAEAGKVWDGKRAVWPGDWLRAKFRKEFGRGLASRWFQ